MIREYIDAAMKRASCEILSADEGYYGEIPGFDGVYSNAPTLEECRSQLEEVLEEWLLLCVSKSLPIPVVDRLELKIKEPA